MKRQACILYLHYYFIIIVSCNDPWVEHSKAANTSLIWRTIHHYSLKYKIYRMVNLWHKLLLYMNIFHSFSFKGGTDLIYSSTAINKDLIITCIIFSSVPSSSIPDLRNAWIYLNCNIGLKIKSKWELNVNLIIWLLLFISSNVTDYIWSWRTCTTGF